MLEAGFIYKLALATAQQLRQFFTCGVVHQCKDLIALLQDGGTSGQYHIAVADDA